MFLRHRSALLLAFGLLPAAAIAQETTTTTASRQTLLPYLPESTILAISVPDLDASIGEFSQMPLAKMWREAEVQAFVADAKEMIQHKFAEGLEKARAEFQAGKMPVDPDKLLALRLNGGTFALTQLKFEEGDFGPLPAIGLLLHLDFGSTAPQWNDLLKMGLAMLEQNAANEFAKKEWSVGDVKVVTLAPNQAPPGFPMALHFAMVPNGILLGTLEDQFKATLESLVARTPRLAASQVYQTNMQYLKGKGSEAELFMRTGPLFDFLVDGLKLAAEHDPDFAQIDPEGIGRAIDALGLRSIQSVRATSDYENGKAVTSTYVVAPAPERKGLLAGTTKNLDTAFLKWVPKDAVGFSATTMDPMSIYDALVAALKAYDPNVAEMAMAHLAQMEQKIGFNLRDDFFGAIGHTAISWSMPMASIASPPETAILLEAKDTEKLVKVVKALTQMSQGMVEVEEAERRGVKTYQFRFNFDPTGGMGANPLDMFSPSFAFKDGYMVLGFTPGDIRRVFQRMDRTEDDPKGDIRGNKEFAVYLESIPEGVQSLSFTDWKANFESYYQVATSLLAFVPMNEDVPIDMSLLPDAGTLTKHLFGSLSYGKADGNGIREVAIGPFGPEAVLLGAVVLGAVGGVVATMGRF